MSIGKLSVNLRRQLHIWKSNCSLKKKVLLLRSTPQLSVVNNLHSGDFCSVNHYHPLLLYTCKCKCKCNLYFKSVYRLQETRATKALGRLDRRLTVPSEALENSKENKFSFSAPPPGIEPGLPAPKASVLYGANHLTNATAIRDMDLQRVHTFL